MVFREWKELPAVEAVFKGVRPAVVALIAAPLVKLARTAVRTKHSDVSNQYSAYLPLLLSLAAALLIWLGHVNPVWVILATIILTLIVVKLKIKN